MRFDRTRAARMRQLLTTIPPGRLLDIGCYDGQLIDHVSPAYVSKFGTDIATGALDLARQRSVRVTRAEVETGLPFRDGSFQTVVAAEIIEHVFDTEAFVQEAARVLAPRGYLLLTTPNLVALSGRAKLVLGKSPANVEFDAAPGTSGHVRYFTFDTLEVLLNRAGLDALGRWTNVVHFSVLGSSELAGRLFPGMGHTLITLARRRS